MLLRRLKQQGRKNPRKICPVWLVEEKAPNRRQTSCFETGRPTSVFHFSIYPSSLLTAMPSPSKPYILHTERLSSHLLFGPYVFLPLFSALVWLGGLAALMGLWCVEGELRLSFLSSLAPSLRAEAGLLIPCSISRNTTLCPYGSQHRFHLECRSVSVVRRREEKREGNAKTHLPPFVLFFLSHDAQDPSAPVHRDLCRYLYALRSLAIGREVAEAL